MSKEKLTHRLFAKIAAYFLLAASLCALLGSVVAVIAAWRFDVYTVDAQTLKASQFRSACVSMGDNLAYWASRGEYDLAESQTERTNAVYRLTDDDGALLWQSADFDAVPEDYVFSAVFRPGRYVAEYVRSGAEAPEAGEVLVEARVRPDFPVSDHFYWTDKGIDLLYAVRYAAYIVGVFSLALCAACIVFLMCAAGHRSGTEALVPGYLYKAPFDLMTAALLLWVFLVVSFADELMNGGGADALNLLLLPAAMLAVALPAVGWLSSFAMRVKLGGWYRRTVIFFVLRALWRAVRWVCRGLFALLRALPLTWKTALGLLAVCLFELLLLANGEMDNMLIGWFIEKLVLVPLVLYIAVTLRRLQKGGRALAAGDLAYQTDTRRMLWDFKQHGEDLNGVALGMSRAVEERVRSERLKTELITNVSHDIKTPLTSIVNYVDLLKRNTDPEKTAEYLDVLDRQSRRLKKLTEDLIEASKASTGNVEVSVSRHSVSELMRQAVGEYGERLAAAGIEPVLTLPPGELYALADGGLTWRVLDNLFSNACKYAQEGTRFYIGAEERDGFAVMSFKNVSRERLNIPADELLERFVRGDAARGGEGSGLGLHIARSLTEVQGGRFSLSVDGDLFKVEVALPERA